jgi:branched-chain amino acid transport system permease protein
MSLGRNELISLAVLLVLAVMPAWSSSYAITFCITAFMYVALSGAWNLFSGMTGYVSLGQGLFFGIGAYAFATAMAILGWNPLAAFAASVTVAAASALVLGLVLFSTRLRIAYFAIVMLGFNEIAKTIIANTKSLGSSYGLTVPPLSSNLVAYYFLLVLAFVVTGSVYALKYTRWGYGLKAIVGDEVAAEMTGIDTLAHKLAMFVLSAVFIALAGGMVAWYWSYIDPYMAFDLTISFEMVVMTVFGGFGTVLGPVLGAVVMSGLKEVLSTSLPNIHPIVFGVLIVVLVLWCPGGIIQVAERLRKRFRAQLVAAGKGA